MGSATCPGALREGAPHPAPRGAAGVGGGRQPADMPQRPQPLTSPEPTATLGHPAALSRSLGEPAGWVGGRRRGAPRPVPRPDPPSCILNGGPVEEAGWVLGRREQARPLKPAPRASGHLCVHPGPGTWDVAAEPPDQGAEDEGPRVSVLDTPTHTPVQRCLGLPPGHLPLSALSQAAPPRDPLPAGGSPALHPAACLLQSRSPAGHVVPAASLWPAGPSSGRAGWRAALAPCPAASLTGCQLAPRVLGPVPPPCALGGRGARAHGRGGLPAWAGCSEPGCGPGPSAPFRQPRMGRKAGAPRAGPGLGSRVQGQEAKMGWQVGAGPGCPPTPGRPPGSPWADPACHGRQLPGQRRHPELEQHP